MERQRTVYKYALSMSGRTPMHEGAQILTVQMQHHEAQAQVWALVDPSQPMVDRALYVAGTGRALPPTTHSSSYVGTFQLLQGDLVFHVFDLGEKAA